MSDTGHHLQALYTPREVGFTNVASSHRPLNIFLKLFRVIAENSCCIMVQGVLVIRLLQHDIEYDYSNYKIPNDETDILQVASAP